MKLACAFGVSLALTLIAVPAAADVYSGSEVTVNPEALNRLLMPGENARGIIHLHMPRKHKTRHVARRKPAAAPTADVATAAPPPAEAAPAPPPPRPRRTRTASATPPPASTAPPADLSSLPEDSAARLVGGSLGGTPTPTPAKPVKPAKPQRVAKAPPPPVDSSDAAIPFSLDGSS